MTVADWMEEIVSGLDLSVELDVGFGCVAGEDAPRVQSLLERVAARMGAGGRVRDAVWNIGPGVNEDVEREVVLYFRSLEAQELLRTSWAEIEEVGA